MAKTKKKSPTKVQQKTKAVPESSKFNLFDELDKPKNIIIIFGLLFIALVFFYKPITIDGLDVQGSDVISNIGNTKQIKTFQEETGERALWNPYMFSGMPIYHRFGAVSWSLDTLINGLDVLIDWRIWYLWLGALGMFLLARYLGLNTLAGLTGAIGFILLPHFHALIVVGHFSKLRAIMWMPMVLLTFLVFINRRNLLSMLLFTLAFSLQIRTQHYQIIFYTILLLTFVGIVPYLNIIKEKNRKDFIRLNGLFLSSMILLILIVAQPLFVIRDYTPYSTRGGNATNIEQKAAEEDTKGVGFDYATNWSVSIPEFWDLIVPKFHGGTTQELYTGKSVPQLRNKIIPAYWGDMPFTQSYEYLSIILAFLALVAILFRWQKTIVKSLTFLTILALMLSLGKNFSPLYKLFFYYVPYFDKFRVPMMILTLVSFNICILAAIGLDFIFKNGLDTIAKQKNFYIFSGGLLIFLLIPYLIGSNFSLSSTSEYQRFAKQYDAEQAQQIITMLRDARLDILQASVLRSFLFLTIGVSLLILYLKKKEWKTLSILGLTLLVFFDLGLISYNYLDGKFLDKSKIEKQTYRENELDRIIKRDTSLYRVLPPIRGAATDSRWTYHYQSIGGLSAAKLQVIQDIFSNSIVVNALSDFPLNLNVISMLNGKYIVSNRRFLNPDLQFMGNIPQNNINLYMNNSVLPRAFFVDSVMVIEDGAERLKFMNSPIFFPKKIALLEEPLSEIIYKPDSSSAKISLFEPNKLIVDVYTDKTALLVLSEVYYPKGWKATLENGEGLKINKTNHILRSMVIPEGKHTITLEFKPSTYYAGIRISWVGLSIVYIGLLILLYRTYGEKIKGWFQKKP